MPPSSADAGNDRSHAWPYNCTALEQAWTMVRLLVLYPGTSDNRWDCLTKQLPDSAQLSERPHAQFMFGGGNVISTLSFVDTVGCADDDQVEF